MRTAPVVLGLVLALTPLTNVGASAAALATDSADTVQGTLVRAYREEVGSALPGEPLFFTAAASHAIPTGPCPICPICGMSITGLDHAASHVLITWVDDGHRSVPVASFDVAGAKTGERSPEPTNRPWSRPTRHFSTCDWYRPSRRNNAPRAPNFVNASYSATIRSLYSAENVRRRGRPARGASPEPCTDFLSKPVIVTRGHPPQLSEEQIRILPPFVDVPTAAAVLGIGRTAAYELIRTQGWPTPVLRLDKPIRVPTAPLLQLVGVSR